VPGHEKFLDREKIPDLSVEKAIPGFFNCRLAKDASANLTNFLVLSEPAKFGGRSCAA
jgi:hypothetical protein